MSTDRELIDFLSKNYAGFLDTQTLWATVDGNPALVYDQASPRTRWAQLVQQMNAGAVSRIKLLIAALNDYPGSAVLLDELLKAVPEDAKKIAHDSINAFRLNATSELIEANKAFKPLESLPPELATAAVASELYAAPEEELAQAKPLFQLAKEKFVETIVTEGTRAAFLAIPLLGHIFN